MLKNAEAVGKVGNIKCGDEMKLYLKIENGTIVDAKFKTFGCVSAIASLDVACDLLKDKTLEAAAKIKNQDILKILGEIPAQKIHCSFMAEEVIAAAITDFNKRSEK